MKQQITKPLRCLIIDDQIAVHKIIKSHINKVPWLEFSASCISAVKALEVMAACDYDIIFINMDLPDISGPELLDIVGDISASVVMMSTPIKLSIHRFKPIVTDFILKPVTFEKFLKTVQQVRLLREARRNRHDFLGKNQYADGPQQPLQVFKKNEVPDKIPQPTKHAPVFGKKIMWVRIDKNLISVAYQHLYMVRGWGNYVQLYTEGQMHCVRVSMTLLMQSLPDNFVKTHKSYIVNSELVKQFTGNEVLLKGGQHKAKISKNLRGDVFKKLGPS